MSTILPRVIKPLPVSSLLGCPPWFVGESRDAQPERAPSMPEAVALGMPHLCYGGLSETWLLKELGHRHWSMLAAATGRTVPDFRDAAGEPVYPAFVAISIRDAAFRSVRQHDELLFSSRIARISRSQFTSVHRLSAKGRTVGMVELTSTFVKRMEKGRNRSMARIPVDGLPPVSPTAGGATLAATAAAIRAGRWREHLGFKKEERAESARLILDPCPSQDFNGVDLLYFAAYQAFIDRAEWSFFRMLGLSTVRRDLVYRGNLEPGERLAIVLLGLRRTDTGLAHWCRIEREEDAAPLADVFTLRAVS